MTSEITTNAISSQESADGHAQLDLLEWLTMRGYGPDHAPASRSAPQESSEAPTTSGTCGQSSRGSSRSADLQRSLESRLRVALGAIGSPEYALTWKTWTMRSGPPICALRALPPRTFGSVCTGWPTPNAGPQNDSDMNWQNRRAKVKAQRNNGNGFGMNLSQAAQLAGWATPTTRDHKDGATDLEKAGVPINSLLGRQVSLTFGQAQSQSHAGMTSGGALNPAHSRWLMGYPPEWDASAPTATPSSRKSRRRS